MDPEMRRLLEENLAIAKNNNDLLRSMRHHQWLSLLTSSIFWIVMLVLPFFLYQQYIEPLWHTFSPTSTSTGPFGLPSSAELQKLIDSFKAGRNGQ